ncbi:hypothetical protein VTO73DRAFT_14403 [Trametes versicolor]
MRHTAILDLHEDITQEIERRLAAILNMRKEISQLRSIHNLVAPVNSLPPELLIMIFSLAGDDLVSVTHVCQHWRDVALHAPGLWTHVGNTSPEGVKTYLRRSKELPLDISLTVLEFRPWLPCLRLVTQSLTSLSSQLEVLSIRDCGSPLGVVPPGPSLLTNIELTGKECVGDALLLLDLLERSPSLERLKICGPFNHRGLVPDPHRTVPLPRLKRVEMHGGLMKGAGTFLASLVLPAQTDITLHTEWNPMQLPLADFIPAFDPGNVKLHSLQGLKRLELSWGYRYGGLSLRAYRHSEDFIAPVLDLQVYGTEPSRRAVPHKLAGRCVTPRDPGHLRWDY